MLSRRVLLPPLQMPRVFTRLSPPTLAARPAPQDCPITETAFGSSLPKNLLSRRAFSTIAQSMPLISSSTVTRGRDESTARAGGFGPMADGVQLFDAIVMVSADG